MTTKDMVLLKNVVKIHEINAKKRIDNSSFKEIFEIYDKLNKNKL